MALWFTSKGERGKRTAEYRERLNGTLLLPPIYLLYPPTASTVALEQQLCTYRKQVLHYTLIVLLV